MVASVYNLPDLYNILFLNYLEYFEYFMAVDSILRFMQISNKKRSDKKICSFW